MGNCLDSWIFKRKSQRWYCSMGYQGAQKEE